MSPVVGARTDTDTAVSFEGLRVQYGSTVVVEGLDLQIAEGEFTCFLGPSGCGKSTMLRIIGELAEQAGGRTRVMGTDPGRAWDQLGYVFQAARLVPWRSAVGNVVLGLQLRGVAGSRRELRERAMGAMEIVGVSHLASRPAHQLSGGEQQRVAIARALAVEPRILLMDEPFSALDVQTRRALRREIVSLWERTGLTIVFVTHDVDEALIVGSRVVVFSPKPTQLLADIPVTLAKPADVQSPQFLAQHDHVVSLFESSDDAVDEITGRTV